MDVKIFTNIIEEQAKIHIEEIAKRFPDSKIRIMPDVHEGKGSVIGFTMPITDKISPSFVGVDISCGMLCVKLGDEHIDFQKLDNVIRTYIPSGFGIHERPVAQEPLIEKFNCYDAFENVERIVCSMGTLGGGNHFIEIDKGESGYYLVIHTGSRNLGKQVCEYYQNIAIKKTRQFEETIPRQDIIARLKAEGREKEIQNTLKGLKTEHTPDDMCCVYGEDLTNYLHDMHLCQLWAKKNRETIAHIIAKKMGFDVEDMFHTTHNYIGDDNIVRKGAISAYKDETVLIPMNMRDGCIIARGKGNSDWNCSAPHGAGRLMSRAAARKELSVADFTKTMDGIYTTSVSADTIDEAPMAYKPMESIVENISPTVDIIEVIKPVYNFKAD